jgi:hypothetical protein
VPTVIEVAWIGVAGVAIGGFITIAGTAVNGRIAHRAAETTIEGEHRHRVWDKQSAAYEETVREVRARQTRRHALTSRGDTGNIGSHPREEIFKHEERGRRRGMSRGIFMGYNRLTAPVGRGLVHDRRAISLPLAKVTRGQPRPLADNYTRRSAPLAAVVAALPKLIVRVRFSSPAPPPSGRSATCTARSLPYTAGP